MKGLIMVYNEEKQAGGIATAAGNRYIFPLQDWTEELTLPERGMEVEFELNESGRAHSVRLALPDSMGQSAQAAPIQTVLVPTETAERYAPVPKRKSILTLLAMFLGGIGAHKFYMGAWGWGLAYIFGLMLLSVLSMLHPAFSIFMLAFSVFIAVEWIRYVWMTDAQFDTKLKAYQAKQPGPFAFFW